MMRSTVTRQKKNKKYENTKIITTRKELQKKLHVLLVSPLGGARVRNFPESTLLTILIYAKRTPRFSVLCMMYI